MGNGFGGPTPSEKLRKYAGEGDDDGVISALKNGGIFGNEYYIEKWS